MYENRGEVVPFTAHIPNAYSNNTPISSVKLDGPKTSLIWSQQCAVSLQSKGLIGYALGDKEQLKSDYSKSK